MVIKTKTAKSPATVYAEGFGEFGTGLLKVKQLKKDTSKPGAFALIEYDGPELRVWVEGSLDDCRGMWRTAKASMIRDHGPATAVIKRK